MAELVSYEKKGDVAVVTMDDGRANALSTEMIEALHAGLTRAEGDAKAVLLVGREGKFCAGFDLKTMMSGVDAARQLVTLGGELLVRLYGLTLPVVVACTAHALAGGSLVLLSADTRIGVDGPFKVGLNEVSIGMTLPILAQEFARDRLDPRHLTQATMQARVYTPAEAVEAGYLDRVVAAGDLLPQAMADATRLAALPTKPYAATKARLRAKTIQYIRDTVVEDMAQLAPPQT